MTSNGSNGNPDSRKEEKKLYYHGLKEQKKIDVSKLKYVSLVIAVLGVALILIAAQGAQAPMAKISDVYGNYLMNYAVVRVEGNVVSVPYVSETGGKLSVTFSVNDGTGSIDIRVYSPLAEKLIEEGKVPFPGDRIEAEIQLRVRETYTYGMLQYLDGLKFISKAYSSNPPKVTTLTEKMANEYVYTEGLVTSLNNVSSGILMEVDTGSGKVTVLIPKVLLVVGKAPEVALGDQVKAAGVVYLYKGSSPEIVVRDLKDFRVMGAQQVPQVSLNELKDHVGETVSVEATLEKITYKSGQYLVTVSDGGVSAVLYTSRDVLAEINPFQAGSGSRIKAIGLVGDNGTLKVSKFEVINPVRPELSKIKDLSADMLGRIVVVEGNVVSTANVGSNLKLVISDGTGEIAVFIPGSVVKELDENVKGQLKAGLGVKVAGYLDEYRGTLEVIPYTPDAIVAYGKPIGGTTETTTPNQGQGGNGTITLSELSSASGTVKLKVKWEAVYYSKPNYLIEVSDDTGKANLTVPRDMIPNPLKAGTGSELEITYNADDSKVVSIDVVKAVASPLVETGKVSKDMLGKTVVVQGTVKSVYTGSFFVKLTIDDGSGELVVFIPKSVLGDKTFSEGDTVKIGGYVTEYRGTFEVVPYRGDAVIKE
ncbi:DNA-binding protein [Thermococcus sp. AM4]|uniref:DNA-binding protein n=1 Tax=Thermococcus sp. (strain AM4) TaxID=246969 RepID=UPI0001871369|nr:DNA-binding protein [Thermococcus sp. AM4]EEB73572.1 OB-fold nucleic acid binding domain protein [Thermococcus sp. AM4]